MRVLFLSRWFPHPPDNGSKIRIFHLLKALTARHTVHLVSFDSELVTNAQRLALQLHCASVETTRYRPFQPNSLRALAGFLSPRPRSVEDTFSPEFQALAVRAAHTHQPEVVIASQIDMTPYALALPVRRKIFEELELATLHEQYTRAAAWPRKLRAGLMWWKQARYARGLLRAFDICTVVSAEEQQRAQALTAHPDRIHIIPNGVDVARMTGEFGPVEPDTLIYSGALTYSANFDAMDYFLREIYPRVRAERPSVQLRVTGKTDDVLTARLPRAPGVTFTGYLEDVRPAVARSAVCLAPLRLGGGTRLKILEAMALGTPVVATAKGAEGLAVANGHDILIADDPAAFAAAVLRLLREADLRQRLSANARRTVAAQYDWAAIGQRFTQVIEHALD
jgi:glycosyltransferase involved in cell wall biosynthesis